MKTNEVRISMLERLVRDESVAGISTEFRALTDLIVWVAESVGLDAETKLKELLAFYRKGGSNAKS